MKLSKRIERSLKFYLVYLKHWYDGEKNMLNETLRPAMCKTCTNVLGRDVMMFQNGICERCKAPARTVARDETERVYNEAFTGKMRERAIERHRAEKQFNEKQNAVVLKNNAEVVKEAERIKNTPL